jgi:hypothetical protein
LITEEQKQILTEAEAQLREAGCPNVARLLIQRGVGLHVSGLSGKDWREERKLIQRFVDEAHLVRGE